MGLSGVAAKELLIWELELEIINERRFAMTVGLLAASTALLIWAINLTQTWKVLNTPDEDKDEVGKRFIKIGIVLMISGFVVGLSAGTTGELVEPTASLGIATLLAGFGVFLEGLILRRKWIEKIKEGLKYGRLMAISVALACFGVAFWMFATGK